MKAKSKSKLTNNNNISLKYPPHFLFDEITPVLKEHFLSTYSLGNFLSIHNMGAK